MHDTGRALVERARTAGAVRPELTAADVHRMVHGIALITENLPDRAAAADRMLTVLLAGLRPTPNGATSPAGCGESPQRP
ncbi:hypothetical protein Athai_42320 [Actinocatenispora thailandica]|uniref:Transcriptional regulator SbtR-like C-terminal domain-containing protein n=2 Tax=Actinocatenispora thailandica TaxID=227318 RepID=A0A7R7DS15_9ACTN|nr:hypothetical protein Athai_42320 [Actinocatenispora thailandica]